MSSPDYTEYRNGVVSIKSLTQQARQVAAAMVDDGLPARNVRKKLYDAMNSLQSAVDYIDSDLINLDQTDKDLS
jgi:hypothetical protein